MLKLIEINNFPFINKMSVDLKTDPGDAEAIQENGEYFYRTFVFLGGRHTPNSYIVNLFRSIKYLKNRIDQLFYKYIYEEQQTHVKLKFSIDKKDYTYLLIISENGIFKEELYCDGYCIIYDQSTKKLTSIPDKVVKYFSTFECIDMRDSESDLSLLEDAKLFIKANNHKFKKKLITFLNSVNLKVSDIELDLEENILIYKDGLHAIPLEKDSKEIQKLIALSSILLPALEEQKILFFDNFGYGLDLKTVAFLMDVFNDHRTNPAGTQVFFSVCDAEVLDYLDIHNNQILDFTNPSDDYGFTNYKKIA